MKPLILLLALAFADHTSAGHAQDQQDVVDAMSDEYDLFVQTTWMPCGFENAFYIPRAVPEQPGIVAFCLDNEGGWVQTAAHEMGHAMIDQLDLDPGPDPQANERGADELGVLWLLEHERYDDVADGAKKYMRWNDEGDDEHPPSMARAYELLCLLDGAEGGSPQCQGLYAFKRAFWGAQLHRTR